MEEEKKSVAREATDLTITFNLNDIYFEDETVYAPYSECEALEIVEPIEIKAQETLSREEELQKLRAYPARPTVKKSKRKKHLFKKLFNLIINLIFLTGDNTIALFIRCFKRLRPLLLLPVRIFKEVVLRPSAKFSAYLKSKPASISAEIKAIAEKKAEKKSANKKPPYFRTAFGYIFNTKRILTTVFNIALPLAVIFCIYSFYQTQKTSVFALEVIYNGNSIGYIESKDVFEEGRSQALSLIEDTAENTDIRHSFSEEPLYKITRVCVNQLSNSQMISENIIDCSDTDYVRACGIYIDGEFLCAVKNESDAITVFEYLLEPYKKQVESSATVAFVEEISLENGLFPENSEHIIDSYALRTMLSNPKQEAVYHTFTETDTVRSVRLQYGLSLSELSALNPGVDLKNRESFSSLLVSRQVNYVRVKVMRTATRTEVIPYETIEKNSSSLAKGTKKTSQQGADGKKEITELVTYIDGEISYTTVISEKITKKPVDEIILIGTKTYTSSSSGWTWPTRGAYHISSYYGYRDASISGWGFHGGIDIVVGGQSSSGIPVVAAASGTVEKVQQSYSGYGYMVLINHGNGIKSRYAHMLAGSITVYTGQKVSKGQQIGKIGSTGNSTGPHLHFEVIVNGSKVNPLKYVSK